MTGTSGLPRHKGENRWQTLARVPLVEIGVGIVVSDFWILVISFFALTPIIKPKCVQSR
jgi:hypothetical protein